MQFFKKLLGGLAPRPTQARPPRRTDFDPGDFSLRIQYRNYKDEDKIYVGDRRTLRRRREHLSVQVVPTGQRIALKRDRIQNLAEVEAFVQEPLPPEQGGPTRTERRVLAYHKNHGTTSPLYRNLRQRFPEQS